MFIVLLLTSLESAHLWVADPGALCTAEPFFFKQNGNPFPASRTRLFHHPIRENPMIPI
jgi:hypothetical protein